MFGDPLILPNNWPICPLGQVCDLKSGKFVTANDIYSEVSDGLFPCFGGNGLRGYVVDYTHEGNYPLIGRQGALCGNIQYATGKFHATEHAVVTRPKIEMNTYWLYHLLCGMKLNRLATGAAQPGLAVTKLEQENIPLPPIALQNQFAAFVQQVDKSKHVGAKHLTKTIISQEVLYVYRI